MTVTVLPIEGVKPPATSATASRQRFGHIVASEWTKFRSVRSSWVSLGLTVLGTVGVGALICAETAANWKSPAPGSVIGWEPANLSLSGWYLAQLIIGVLAVVMITGEYGSGLIRTTFAAVPRRREVLAAKTLVLTAVALVTATVCSFASFFIGQWLLHRTGYTTTIGAPGVLHVVAGSALFVTLIALLGLGIGTIVRSTAGATGTLFAILFVPAILADAFPPSWHHAIQEFAPLNAGSQILNLHRPAAALGPWAGLGVLALYTAAALTAGFVLIGTRDV
jgi:ABC-type transport system involved in multi-copper enzyme maturation permease subunit